MTSDNSRTTNGRKVMVPREVLRSLIDLAEKAGSEALPGGVLDRARESLESTTTNIAHWSLPYNLDDDWDHRSARAARFVAQGATLLDIGCGKMAIERHLPPGCRYIPCDVVRRDERTIICDLNKGEYPPLGGATHISALGVLEYLDDPKEFWQWLGRSGARILFAYVPLVQLEGSKYRWRNKSWRNAFSREEIIALAAEAGLNLASVEEIPPDNLLFVFDPARE